MKLRLGLFSVAIFVVAIFAAQNVDAQFQQGLGPQGLGPQAFGPGALGAGGLQSAVQPFSGNLRSSALGRSWLSVNLADQGFGYDGPYISLGGKRRLFEDSFNGRWLGETQLNHSIDGGGFFADIGVERVFSVAAAGADVSVGFFYNFDGDEQNDFENTFNQVGISTSIKTQRWDVVANGYFPVGTSDFSLGDPTGGTPFFGSSLILAPGINAALQGFDATLRLRPRRLQFVNGTVDIGGYGYESDLVEFFGGGRVRFGLQLPQGAIVSAEVNFDDRFQTTGALTVGWVFGANAGGLGNEYSGVGRDLERSLRRDHITRFTQNAVLALDPDTGLPYDVIHVDNTADAAIGNGTFETRFTTLAEAEAASDEGDIIFVHTGDGTARGLSDGITLQDDQLFLGDGVSHPVPIQNGQNLIVSSTFGVRPTISGSNLGNAINLANNNVVRGFNIDGTAGTGGTSTGIFADGFLTPEGVINSGIIEDTTVTGAILFGANLNNIGGDWSFARNNFDNNGIDGVFISEACDPDSVFVFEDNTFNGNGFDGLHFENFDAQAITLLNNETNDNGRDGLRLENFKNQSGNGLVLDLLAHEATGNAGFGANIDGGDGNLRVINGNFSGNGLGGLRLANWTNTDPTTTTFIGPSVGGVSNFSNNPAGVGIDIELDSGTQNLIISNLSADNNFIGVRTTTTGIGTVLNTTFVNNGSFSNNANDGVRAVATSGSTQNIVFDQPGAPLQVVGNGGVGINLLAGLADGNISSISASIENVNFAGNAVGLNAISNQDGLVNLLLDNFTSTANGTGVTLTADNLGAGQVNSFVVTNGAFSNPLGNDITANTLAGTLTDLVFNDNTFTYAAELDLGDAISVTAAGINNFTRLTALTNTMTEVGQSGFDITTAGDATLVATIQGNNIQGSGEFADLDMLPFFDGISITATGTSSLNYELIGNVVNGSAEFGINQTAVGASEINAVWVNNDFSANDVNDDATTMPLENLGIDTVVFNGGLSTTCLAISSNLLATTIITNVGPPAAFLLEVDGVTNTPTPAPANVTTTPFGVTCQGLIDAQGAAFEALGFPPTDHD